MDKDGYPEEHELKTIEKWDFRKKPVTEFIQYIVDRWMYAESGYSTIKGKRVLQWWLSTAGWSGNESIIGAMKCNFVFWLMAWEWSAKGGHYFFKIRLDLFKVKNAKV